jgi:tetratricopeptide (TPR) repeat protein
VHTEAITFMSGTADPLCGVFFLSGILVLVPGFSRSRVMVACLLFLMALFSKETAVVFPLLAMGLLFYQSESRWSPRTYLKTWPFWLMAGFYLVARGTLLNFSGFFGFYNDTVALHATIVDRCYTFLATLPAYLRLLIWPTSLHMRASEEFLTYASLWRPQVLAGLGILAAAITGVVWKPARRATPLAWGLLWAAAVHIPQAGILVRSDAIFLEHWLYLPTMGLALGSGESLLQLSGSLRAQSLRPILAGLTLLIICLFGVMTFEQNKTWRDPIVFFSRILDFGDDTYKVRDSLGNAYQQTGQYEEAVRQFRIEVALSDNFAEAHYNLGTALINAAQVRYDLAGAVTITRINPTSPYLTESIEHFQRALALDPDYYRAYDALAYVYGNHLGDHAKESEYHARAAAIRKKLGID